MCAAHRCAQSLAGTGEAPGIPGSPGGAPSFPDPPGNEEGSSEDRLWGGQDGMV